MAEIELAALSKECLDRRVGSIARLRLEVAAWEGERNERLVDVKWRFTTADAHGGRPPWVDCPDWDGVRRLYWGSEVIKEFRRLAPDQMRILEECQQQGWKTEISLKATVVELKKCGVKGSLWIENTVRNLNKGLRRIRFHEDSKEQVIRWEPVGS